MRLFRLFCVFINLSSIINGLQSSALAGDGWVRLLGGFKNQKQPGQKQTALLRMLTQNSSANNRLFIDS
jgi:hypothetical protein